VGGSNGGPSGPDCQGPGRPSILVSRLAAALARPGSVFLPIRFTEDIHVRTFSPKPADIQRVWYEVDADGAVLGRLATEVARVLRGKHKPIFAAHVDTGDHVIVVNTAKIQMAPGKAEKKFYYRHSGYPGGLTARSYSELLVKQPEETFRRAVKGMLPKGPLGRHMLRKLKVYAGPTHPHSAQGPQPLVVDPRTYRAP
jgi:large subunit ribosomal protein L13